MIAELLLKRTTATAVSQVFDDFLIRFPRVQELAAASEDDLVECLSGVGLQHQRARSLKRLSTWLIATCEGDVPSDLESLLEVPGLGAYSAAAVLSFGYDTPIAILDANVERILVRVFGDELPPRPSGAVLNAVAQHLLPANNHREYNYGLLDLGRLVCRYVNPKCNVCPLNTVCDFLAHTGPRPVECESMDPRGNTRSKLKTARRERGLSLRRLAELAGVSKLTVIRIESGKTNPRHETLEKLAVALEIELHELTD